VRSQETESPEFRGAAPVQTNTGTLQEQRNAIPKVGNLTWPTIDKPVSIFCWGLYLSRDQTDLTVRGQTFICELVVLGGKGALEGSPGTFDAATTATTVEVGAAGADSPEQLTLRNASIGRAVGDPVRGQVTVHRASRLLIGTSRCTELRLMTQDRGEIVVRGLRHEGSCRRRAGAA
jgi:hypothetical protein